MEERYIEINEITRPYLLSRKSPGPEDLAILRGLIHDRKWWSGFNRASPEKKREMLRLPQGKDIGNKNLDGGTIWQNFQ